MECFGCYREPAIERALSGDGFNNIKKEVFCIMKGKKLKKAAAAAFTCGMLLVTGVAALAASETARGNAGSTGIVAEIGFNGTRAYAKLSATANVYATMEAEAYYWGGSEPRKFSGRIEENSYGEISTNCNRDVFIANCRYEVTGTDGSWSHFMYINTDAP